MKSKDSNNITKEILSPKSQQEPRILNSLKNISERKQPEDVNAQDRDPSFFKINSNDAPLKSINISTKIDNYESSSLNLPKMDTGSHAMDNDSERVTQIMVSNAHKKAKSNCLLVGNKRGSEELESPNQDLARSQINNDRVLNLKKEEKQFDNLKKLLLWILLHQDCALVQTNLNELEKYILKLFIKKKRYFVLGGIKYNNIDFFAKLRKKTTDKRTEERLKKIFKMSVKYLRKQFNSMPEMQNECRSELQNYNINSEDNFFYYYFGNFMKKKDFDFRNLFRETRGTNVNKDYSRCSINKNFLNKIKDCHKFFDPLKTFLIFNDNELKFINENNNVLAFSKEQIRTKLDSKIEEWKTIFYDSGQDLEVFKAEIKKLFSNTKYKLPWSIIDVACSLRIFKEHIGRS